MLKTGRIEHYPKSGMKQGLIQKRPERKLNFNCWFRDHNKARSKVVKERDRAELVEVLIVIDLDHYHYHYHYHYLSSHISWLLTSAISCI